MKTIHLATAHRAGVMVDLEMRLVLGSLAWLRFAKVLALAKMVLIQLGKEGLVGSLWEHALLLQDGQDTHRLSITTRKWIMVDVSVKITG